jgi:hypothetical protein
LVVESDPTEPPNGEAVHFEARRRARSCGLHGRHRRHRMIYLKLPGILGTVKTKGHVG